MPPRPIARGTTRLVLLAALLASLASLQPRPITPSSIQAPRAWLFLSQNTEEGLSLESALERLTSRGQATSRDLAQSILLQLGVGPVELHDVLGDWTDGAENSLVVSVPGWSDPIALRCAAAWFGLVAEQKAVLAFYHDKKGEDVLWVLDMPGELTAVRKRLDQHGVSERSIQIHRSTCRVLVLDVGGIRQVEIKRLARQTGSTVTRQRGRGECLSAATRGEAKQRYHQVLQFHRPWAKPRRQKG